MSSFESPRPGSHFDPVREMHESPEADIRFLQNGHHEHYSLSEWLESLLLTLWNTLRKENK